jgi:predicted AAA+ superfamily ATPase
MAHTRNRLIIKQIQKRLSFYPVVALQGARQTGKSFLAKLLLNRHFPQGKYLSLDDKSLQEAAQTSTKNFIEEHRTAKPLILDEAQKSPALFDAIKLSVDEKRFPGKFLLLGSTEFSRQSLIRESLTGRMGRVRIYPMNLEECLGHARHPTRNELMTYLERGGLPGIFHVRDATNRQALFQDWLELTCYRDLQQFKTLKLDGDAALKIIRACATLPEPTTAKIATALRLNYKKTVTHIECLTQLFVLTRLPPHPSGTGKTLYIPFDTGIANHLGASHDRLLYIWALNELLVQDSISNLPKSDFYFYRNPKGNLIHLVKVNTKTYGQAWQMVNFETIKKTDTLLMKSFLEKNPNFTGQVLTPSTTPTTHNSIRYLPFEQGLFIKAKIKTQ